MSIVHLNRAGQNLGTFSVEEVQQGLDAGRFLGSDLGWRSGMENWKPLSQWPDLTMPPAALEPLGPAAASGRGPGEPGRGFQPAPTGSGWEPAAYSGESVQDGPPWEQRATLGFFPALAATVKGVLLDPGRTFERMKTEGGLASPFLYYFINSFLMLLVVLFVELGLRGLFGGTAAPQDQGFARQLPLEGLSMAILIPIALIGIPIGLVILSFLNSGLVHLSLMLLGGANKPFEATFRVWNYTQGSTAVVGLVPICGGFVAFVWYFVAGTIGVSKVHGITTGKAFVAVLLPVVLCCGFVLAVYAAILIPTFAAASQGHH